MGSVMKLNWSKFPGASIHYLGRIKQEVTYGFYDTTMPFLTDITFQICTRFIMTMKATIKVTAMHTNSLALIRRKVLSSLFALINVSDLPSFANLLIN
jgi:hypothetical protein